jgi:hypothetical protein
VEHQIASGSDDRTKAADVTGSGKESSCKRGELGLLWAETANRASFFFFFFFGADLLGLSNQACLG